MVTLIDDDLPVLKQHLIDRIIFSVNKALIGGHIDLPRRFSLARAYDTDIDA